MTTSLNDRIAKLIRETGPIPVSVYMQLCLHDPRQGYYSQGEGLGRDFITAPEISQVFGELIGLWCAHEWRSIGAPDPFRLVELGPGRGVLMADVLRATRAISDFHDAADLTLVEASPALRRAQIDRLKPTELTHINTIEAIPDGPILLIANEFLDCLPVRQFIRDTEQWRERVVGLSDANELVFGLSDTVPALDNTPDNAQQFEMRPSLVAIVDALAQRFANHPGRALFIDYGPADAAPDDTLRAYKNGAQISPLETPGDADLTSDVDFADLKRIALAQGLEIHGPIAQGDFLLALGAAQRAEALIRANPKEAEATADAVHRLVDSASMGVRFQAIAISSPNLPPPAGF